ncbi:protein of unknown function [Cupriavidus taiwanensis]|uniref:Resolvase/invertase-type recombinase catalytic domain-containing protein n=1 Tax=Cupriavidus taiwanensis TaxID=164546 RepID=A0A375IHK6_9BURK|nr:protein of unknown function [Cupriavidus taiwanensis]
MGGMDILVYDVSCWERFQDPDESASYDVRCKQAGVRVLYCGEQFENDGSPVSSTIKGVKRTMAGEYSIERDRTYCTVISYVCFWPNSAVGPSTRPRNRR